MNRSSEDIVRDLNKAGRHVVKKILILSVVGILVTFEVVACERKTASYDFTLRDVALQDCFKIPHMGEEYLYKLVAVCTSGGTDRKAYYKMKDPFKGAWRSEQTQTVRMLQKFRIKKAPCK